MDCGFKAKTCASLKSPCDNYPEFHLSRFLDLALWPPVAKDEGPDLDLAESSLAWTCHRLWLGIELAATDNGLQGG